MKLRSIICVSAIAAVASASALTSTNTFARLPVASSFTNTVVAIPLSGCGESSPEIYVTNLVMTSNLKAGDKLFFKDGSTLYAWYIASDGGAWQPYAESTKYGGVSMTPTANTTALACGKACWLVRERASFGSDDKIYLFGQVNDGKPDVTLSVGSDTVTYLPVGCPSVAADLDLSTAWANAVAGDTVQIPDATSALGYKEYTYDSGHWCKKVAKTKTITTPKGPKTVNDGYTFTALTTGEVTVPAGTGFLYGRMTSAGALTLTWGD